MKYTVLYGGNPTADIGAPYSEFNTINDPSVEAESVAEAVVLANGDNSISVGEVYIVTWSDEYAEPHGRYVRVTEVVEPVPARRVAVENAG